jgi:hypothetical protein
LEDKANRPHRSVIERSGLGESFHKGFCDVGDNYCSLLGGITGEGSENGGNTGYEKLGFFNAPEIFSRYAHPVYSVALVIT